MFNRDLDVSAIRLVIVSARDIQLNESSGELKTEISQTINAMVLQTAAVKDVAGRAGRDAVRSAVRDMLRTKMFKPTGRNKPASEYLAQAASEDRFPFINNAVDVNNLLSLETGLPVSLLDADIVGDSGSLRLGRENERYVFNSAGHEIELEGLAVMCGEDGAALGNAIKDSMRGKLSAYTKNVVGFVWTPAALVADKLLDEQAIARRFAALLERHCQATQTSVAFL